MRTPSALLGRGSARAAYATTGLAVALLIGGCGLEAGDASPRATPTSSVTTDEPSVSLAPGVRPLRNPDIDPGVPEILDPGTYVLDRFPVDLAFDIPDGDPPGWHAGKAAPDVAVLLWYTPPEITYGFALWTADNVYADPCDPAAGELEPPIGPSVDDLVAALANLPAFEVSPPVDVTVGAFTGQEIELTAVGPEGDCPEAVPWRGGEDTIGLAPGETVRVQILDVDGVRIVMRTVEPDQRDAAIEAELDQILDSLRIANPHS
jgi:hypothetical protein